VTGQEDRPTWRLPALVAGVLLLLYGYEIFNFSLSIDEELHATGMSTWLTWIEQGRWTMGFLTYALPRIGSLPVISTVIFCAGLGTSAVVLARMFFIRETAQFMFAAFLVCSPIWAHVAEFNTLSWGVGVGLVLVTYAFVLLARGQWRDAGLAAVLLAIAAGIYQVFLGVFVTLVCLQMVASAFVPKDDPNESTGGVLAIRGFAAAAGGALCYFALATAWRSVLHLNPAYVETWIRLSDFGAPGQTAGRRTITRAWGMISGSDPGFLGMGYFLQLVPLAGGVFLVRGLLDRAVSWPGRFVAVIGLLVAFAAALGPVVLSAGTIPTRALIGLPAVCAFLAGCASWSESRMRHLWQALTAGSVVVAASIVVSLFYADHVARQRDELLVARLMARVDALNVPRESARIPFVVVGSLTPTPRDAVRRAEVFGESFFEHGGSAWRIAAYLRILGIDSLEAHNLQETKAAIEDVDAMPVWPAPGSVALTNGVLVFKFVELSTVDGSRALFERLGENEIGDDVGRVELHGGSILIHPGNSTPTTAHFRLGGELTRVGFRMEMARLPPEGLAAPQAANVNVEFLLDGRSLLKTYVDRSSRITQALDVTGGRDLVIRVDNANGKSWYDQFLLSVSVAR
jgi:hypothetical protein